MVNVRNTSKLLVWDIWKTKFKKQKSDYKKRRGQERSSIQKGERAGAK